MMNLFCFTLDGSSESIYEAPHDSSLKDVLPKYHCSPLLRRRAQWTGSDPNISYVQTSNNVRLKRNNRRSCIPTSAIENETSDYTCWTASGLGNDVHDQETELRTVSCQSSTEDPTKELKSGKTKDALPVQSGKSAEEKDGALTSTARRLKMFHDLVQAKKRNQDASGKGKNRPNKSNNSSHVLSNSNPMLTCIGLGKRTEKKSSGDAQQEEVKTPNENLRTKCVWNPSDCSQACSPFYSTCHHLPGHEPPWLCGSNLLLSQATQWERFESLIRELDRKELEFSSATIADSTTDIQPTQDKMIKFGDFHTRTALSPLMKLHDTRSLLEKNGSKPSQNQTEDPPRADTTAEKQVSAVIRVDTPKADSKKRESGVGRIFAEGCKLSSNSMESLYSRQSSSSGVTSDCSSNRDSLRLEDELVCARHFCGRARVHTEFMPSPYDTESLKLKVGDVIDIIHKRPKGIWTGMLNNKIGTFKFIYVEEFTEELPETHKASQKCRSTIHEVLRRLSLEEYSNSLQENGYQTVDDLMRLKEHHLTKLKVTDPEHRHRLLAAVESLQQLRYTNCHLEKEPNQEAKTENTKGDTNTCLRDSGCHMTSDSTDISREDTELQFPCEPVQMTAS
ncbi:SAM domain-containing protein SAMSN-1b [Syngnathus scovelli]|uniref:SAM domain-containing protein SAMSN-1b n=1 Tax=Syngnathus scovelli TaxID=161590 RepID=UPI002110A5FB|nr:SAM domain-containing protein SAMSN-1b [Syngnathus scovelli]